MCCFPFNGTHNQALLCVFDGHGQAGERVSSGAHSNCQHGLRRTATRC